MSVPDLRRVWRRAVGQAFGKWSARGRQADERCCLVALCASWTRVLYDDSWGVRLGRESKGLQHLYFKIHGRQSRRSSDRVLTLHAYALRWLLRWKPRSWGAEQSVALGVANAGLTARRQSAPQRWQPRIWRSRTRLRQIPPVSLCETPDIMHNIGLALTDTHSLQHARTLATVPGTTSASVTACAWTTGDDQVWAVVTSR